MTLRSSALESAALERRVVPRQSPPRAVPVARRGRSAVRRSSLEIFHLNGKSETAYARDLAAWGLPRRGRSRTSRGRRLGPARGPPRALPALPRWRTANTQQSPEYARGLDPGPPPARRRAGCGALSTRCAVVSTGGTHLTHTTHPIMNGSLLCMHTRDTRTIPRQRISCLIIVARHAFTHASLPCRGAKHPRPGSSSGGRRHDGSSALVKGTSALPGTDCSALLLALAAAKDSAHG